MRHKNKIRRFLGQCQPAKKLQKPFTRYRVETGTRFIENQNSIPRNQGPTDQDALPFSCERNAQGRSARLAHST